MKEVIARGHPVRYSFAEYIAHENTSNTKHEYLEGQIFAMAGGTPEHSALIASLTAHLSAEVRGGPCRVHTTELRVRVAETGLATYPDVSVLCGPWERDPEDRHTLRNLIVVVEVLSPSTEAYDRGEKLAHYKRIPSLRACLLVAHDREEIEIWYRADAEASWSRRLAGPGERIEIEAIASTLSVDHVYRDAREPRA